MFETRYKKLNTAQRSAVDTIDGPLLVIAGIYIILTGIIVLVMRYLENRVPRPRAA